MKFNNVEQKFTNKLMIGEPFINLAKQDKIIEEAMRMFLIVQQQEQFKILVDHRVQLEHYLHTDVVGKCKEILVKMYMKIDQINKDDNINNNQAPQKKQYIFSNNHNNENRQEIIKMPKEEKASKALTDQLRKGIMSTCSETYQKITKH